VNGTQRRARRGFTLLEVLVAVLVLSVVVYLAAQGGVYLTANSLLVQEDARAESELRLAVAALQRDLGAAVAAEAVTSWRGAGLLIRRDKDVAVMEGGWSGGMDEGVLYVLSDQGDLQRTEVATKDTMLVARNITAFEVRSSFGGSAEIALRAGGDPKSPITGVYLVWQP